jgi:hypothetical protein
MAGFALSTEGPSSHACKANSINNLRDTPKAEFPN